MKEFNYRDREKEIGEIEKKIEKIAKKIRPQENEIKNLSDKIREIREDINLNFEDGIKDMVGKTYKIDKLNKVHYITVDCYRKEMSYTGDVLWKLYGNGFEVFYDKDNSFWSLTRLKLENDIDNSVLFRYCDVKNTTEITKEEMKSEVKKLINDAIDKQ